MSQEYAELGLREQWDRETALKTAMDCSRQCNRTGTGTRMQVSQMLPSTYLKKEDVTQPSIVTVDHIEEKNVAPNGQPEEFKYILFFKEFDKGLVLNSTNINSLAQACRSTDTDDWTGKEVVLFVDPSVSFGGKVIGGLRIRPHETRAPARPTRPVARRSPSQEHAEQEIPLAAMDDDVPFIVSLLEYAVESPKARRMARTV